MPQQRVGQTAKAREKDVASRKTAIIGTNFFPNKDEQLRLDMQQNELQSQRLDLVRQAAEYRDGELVTPDSPPEEDVPEPTVDAPGARQ